MPAIWGRTLQRALVLRAGKVGDSQLSSGTVLWPPVIIDNNVSMLALNRALTPVFTISAQLAMLSWVVVRPIAFGIPPPNDPVVVRNSTVVIGLARSSAVSVRRTAVWYRTDARFPGDLDAKGISNAIVLL